MATDEGNQMNVPEIKAAVQAKGVPWEAGETKLTQLPREERRKHLGFNPPGDLTLSELERRGASVAAGHKSMTVEQVSYPTSFNWQDADGNNYVTPVKDQGACGSCVAFGTTAAVEATYQVANQNPNSGIDLSEAYLFYCIAANGGYNCESGWYPSAALAGYENPGVPDDACFPYSAGDQPCNPCPDWQSRVTQIEAWQQLTDTDAMKSWLSTQGPLVACFSVYEDFYAYSSGCYHYASGALEGGHCVCIVGYDDGSECWCCKNSWSTGWGEGGFFWIGYGQCGIESQVFTVDGIAGSSTTVD